jgi:hypothetical protein
MQGTDITDSDASATNHFTVNTNSFSAMPPQNKDPSFRRRVFLQLADPGSATANLISSKASVNRQLGFLGRREVANATGLWH